MTALAADRGTAGRWGGLAAYAGRLLPAGRSSLLKSYPGAAVADEVRDFNAVVADPASFYANPDAVADDAGLTRVQKLRLLGEWAQDLVDRQVADNEGMVREVPNERAAAGSAANVAVLFHQVNTALARVEASPEEAPGLLTRVWRRLTS